MEGFVEWTFEGGPKGNHLVGVTGNRARYQFGMYDIVRERVDQEMMETQHRDREELPRQPIRSEFHSSQNTVHWTIAVRAFWQDLRMQELKKERI